MRNPMDFFSPVQCVGYAAFILGVAAFVQRCDRRFKLLNAGQSLAYAVHFFWLANLPAASSALVSAVRSMLALKKRSWMVVATIVAVNFSAGVVFSKNWTGWLTVGSSCVGTVAIFYMRGVPMRLVLLACTGAWLTNNILSGSIGGTLLEAVIALANGATIVRILAGQRAARTAGGLNQPPQIA